MSWSGRFFGTSMIVAATMALLFAGTLPVSANSPNTIPYIDDFESFSDADSIIGTNGWFGLAASYAVVTTNDADYFFQGTTKPLTNSTHEKVVVLNTEGDAISNLFENTAGLTNVFLDAMYRIVPSESAPAGVTEQTDVQAAFYFNTNGELIVFHSKYFGPGDYSNQFTTASGVVIDTNVWNRVTIVMDYLSDDFFGVPEEKYFSVYVNGDAAQSTEAFDLPDKDSGQTSTSRWFLCSNWLTATNYFLSAVTLAGTGKFDDFVVEAQPPVFGAGLVAVYASQIPADGHGGTISPSGLFYVTEGGSTNLTVTPAPFWDISEITTNGTTLAAITNSIDLSNLNDDVWVTAKFAPQLVSGVPIWWLDANGGNTNDPSADSDNDGRSDKDEWLGSSDPSVSNSVFEIVTVGQANGTNYIEWISAAVDPDLGPYGIEKSTNLVTGWSWANPKYHTRAAGTNRWWESTPAGAMEAFFRVVGTNQP